jgi:asparagine synthase (glutamine-hydrolysing)
MFAFAIWDDSEKALILARDCSGKKPLYFSEQGDQFSFSSEIKGLFELPWIQRDIDEFVLSDFLTYNTVSTPHTMFKGISKFKPGYYMVLKEHKIKKYVPFTELKYTKLEFSNQNELEDMVFNKLK